MSDIQVGFNAVDTIRKAVLTTPELADYGVKTPQQMSNFIELMRREPNIFRYADVVSMSTKKRVFSKMDITRRFLRPGAEASGLTDSEFGNADYSETELDTVKVIGELPISYEALEDNIAGNNLMRSLRSLIMKRVTEDFGDLVWNGDTTSSDPYLAQLNGILAQISTNSYDFSNNTVTRTNLGSTYKQVPNKYLSRINQFKFYLHNIPIFDYMLSLAGVAADRGIQINESTYNPTPFGNEMVPSPLIGTYANGSDTNSQGVFTLPENIKIGIYRPFNIKMIDVPREEQMVLHVSGRIGVKLLVEEMAVLMDNVKHSA